MVLLIAGLVAYALIPPWTAPSLDSGVTVIAEARREAWLGSSDGQVYRTRDGEFLPVGEPALTPVVGIEEVNQQIWVGTTESVFFSEGRQAYTRGWV